MFAVERARDARAGVVEELTAPVPAVPSVWWPEEVESGGLIKTIYALK